MSPSRHPFRPYASRRELAKGRAQVFLGLGISMVALLLAKLSESRVDDERLVQLYVVAAVLYLIATLGPAIRWSNTQAFDTSD